MNAITKALATGSGSVEPLALQLPAAAAVAGIGRSKLYELIKSGDLKSVMRGGRRLVLREDLLAYLRHGADAA
jgi:excisionase family DNA binding protein